VRCIEERIEKVDIVVVAVLSELLCDDALWRSLWVRQIRVGDFKSEKGGVDGRVLADGGCVRVEAEGVDDPDERRRAARLQGNSLKLYVRRLVELVGDVNAHERTARPGWRASVGRDDHEPVHALSLEVERLHQCDDAFVAD